MREKTFAFGVNHIQLNSQERSQFSLSKEQQCFIYENATEKNLKSVVILNTCNRTEIYGEGDVQTAIQLFEETKGFAYSIQQKLFKYTEDKAIDHIFKVASGLDSQVVGDLEILGQFKSAFKNAKESKCLSGYFERLGNNAIQAAKEVRSDTKISSGTVSLSYAATKYIKGIYGSKACKILIIGTGEFGKRIAHNVADYLPNAVLSICNRTQHKAEEIANELNCKVFPFEKRNEAIYENEIIISSVNDSGNYIIKSIDLHTLTSSKVFIDMSIPLSIEPCIRDNHTLVSIDEIGKQVNSTLESRKEDIPVALEIIDKHVNEFLNWTDVFEKSESIHSWKMTVKELSFSCPHLSKLDETEKTRIVGKSMSHFANYIKQRENLPRETQQIIHQFLIESENALACQRAAVQNISHELHNCSACQPR
jgi:glutamyl-tRNA reductase